MDIVHGRLREWFPFAEGWDDAEDTVLGRRPVRSRMPRRVGSEETRLAEPASTSFREIKAWLVLALAFALSLWILAVLSLGLIASLGLCPSSQLRTLRVRCNVLACCLCVRVGPLVWNGLASLLQLNLEVIAMKLLLCGKLDVL